MACAGSAWMAKGGRSVGDGDGLGISGRSPSPLPSPAGRGDWFGRWSAIGRKLLCPDAAFTASSPSGKGGRDRICGTARRARHWNVELRGLVRGRAGGGGVLHDPLPNSDGVGFCAGDLGWGAGRFVLALGAFVGVLQENFCVPYEFASVPDSFVVVPDETVLVPEDFVVVPDDFLLIADAGWRGRSLG